MPTESDIRFMREVFSLAASMRGATSPDPMVGAVIVKNGKIISRGYHGEFASPHAETFALQKAGGRAKGATLYVNLEPCCHFGNNPPCTTNIIKSGISRIVAAMEDPNPLVSGKGFAELKRAGIRVDVGLLESEAKRLNEVFIKFITTNQPFVILKSAMSFDGKIATKTGESFWITGLTARKYSHSLRNFSDAVLIGIETVLKDNPELTVREIEGNVKNPYKIILDSRLRIPLDSKILSNDPEKAIIATSKKASKLKIAKIIKLGAQVLITKGSVSSVNIDELMVELGRKKITGVLIEGGGSVAASALGYGAVDKIVFFYAPKIIGGITAPTSVGGDGIKELAQAINISDVEISRLGEDIMIEGYIVK